VLPVSARPWGQVDLGIYMDRMQIVTLEQFPFSVPFFLPRVIPVRVRVSSKELVAGHLNWHRSAFPSSPHSKGPTYTAQLFARHSGF